MNYKILVVDDEPMNVRLLERMFDSQYQVLCAFSGQEALDLLTQHDVALIICDQRMPEMNGIEFLRRAAEMRPRVIRIIISGYSEVNVLTDALNSGIIYRFVSKPWINEEFQQTVAKALEHYEVTKCQHDLIQTNERLTMQLNSMRRIMGHLTERLEEFDDNAAASLAEILLDEEQHSLFWTEDFEDALAPEYDNEPELLKTVA